jgi:hypothetical protein
MWKQHTAADMILIFKENTICSSSGMLGFPLTPIYALGFYVKASLAHFLITNNSHIL